jgi:hypothetical protein
MPRIRFLLASVLAVGLSTLPLLALEVHAGKVIAVQQKSITIRDDRDNDDDKIMVTAETKITRNGKPAKLSDIGIGDKATIDATEVDGKFVAKSVDAVMPE